MNQFLTETARVERTGDCSRQFSGLLPYRLGYVSKVKQVKHKKKGRRETRTHKRSRAAVFKTADLPVSLAFQRESLAGGLRFELRAAVLETAMLPFDTILLKIFGPDACGRTRTYEARRALGLQPSAFAAQPRMQNRNSYATKEMRAEKWLTVDTLRRTLLPLDGAA